MFAVSIAIPTLRPPTRHRPEHRLNSRDQGLSRWSQASHWFLPLSSLLSSVYSHQVHQVYRYSYEAITVIICLINLNSSTLVPLTLPLESCSGERGYSLISTPKHINLKPLAILTPRAPSDSNNLPIYVNNSKNLNNSCCVEQVNGLLFTPVSCCKDLVLKSPKPSQLINSTVQGSTLSLKYPSGLKSVQGQSCSEKVSSKSSSNLTNNLTTVRLTSVNELMIVINSPLLARLLQQCGDIEANPGPDDVDRSGAKVPRISEVDLQVVSYNVRGLGDEKKCRHLINHFNIVASKNNVDAIIALQETLIQTPLKIPFLWRGNFHLTPGTGNGRGCVTLFSNHLNVVTHSTLDDRAHILVLQKSGDLKISYIVANVYAPNIHNEDKIMFFDEVLDRVTEFEERYECDNVLLLGDFNLIFKESEKLNRVFSGNEKRVAASVGRLLREADFSDAWTDRTDYTWRRPNSNTMSVLDRVMYRAGKLKRVSIKSNWAITSSDHAAVEVNFKTVGQSNGGCKVKIARLDPSLLTCKSLADQIRQEFVDMFSTSDGCWNPHTTLEFAKVCLRSVVERVQAIRKKKEKSDEEEVNDSLNRLIEKLGKISTEEREEKEELITIIEALRQRKEVLIEEKGRRLADRLATKWYNEGEKSNRYFMRLLNRKSPDKLDHLIKENGQDLKDIEEINQAVISFYKELYEDYDASQIESADSDPGFFDNIESCTPNTDLTVSEPITLPELTEVLKTCHDSAPGPDGISYSYLRLLWDIFGPLLVDCWNHSLQTGNLAPSHKLSFLRLIPKAGKDVKRLTNWRPITLSNCDHKLITKTYSKRLTEAASKLINESQTAYIKGRMINDNVRTLIAAIKEANDAESLEGLLISLDARKAFDSVEHNYIRHCLRKFGFHSFVPVFDILYKDLSSDIIVNGGIHKGFKINRGVKQGDALSCILFIMCMEPLIRNLECNRQIDSIASTNLRAKFPKAMAYADDVSCLIKNNQSSVQGVFNEYERLSKISGLQLNADKTEFLILNRAAMPGQIVFRYLNRIYSCEPKPEVKINGILLQMDQDGMRTANVDSVIRKIEGQLWSWSKRGLSTLGKILVLKTFGISQIIYLAQSMCLKLCDFKKINATLYKFIWNRNFGAPKAPERIKREIINAPIKFGGFGMLNIQKLDRSLKLKMLSRLVQTKHPFLEVILRKINLDDFFFPVSNQTMDEPINQAVRYLAEDRQQLFTKEGVTDIAKVVGLLRELKISSIINAQGNLSLTFFMLRRLNKLKVKDLTLAELRSLTRFSKFNGLFDSLDKVMNLNVNNPIGEDKLLYWYKGLKPLTKLTSKQFREANEHWEPICVYKIGAVLSPNENASWTHKVRALTSTRHKNILLKIAHGDWYSKARLHRFGLVDDPSCEACGQVETIKHKVVECPNKLLLWQYQARLEGYDLDNSPEPMEFALGMHQHDDPTTLTMHAEILQLVLYKNPELTPERTIEILSNKINRLDKKLKGKPRSEG